MQLKLKIQIMTYRMCGVRTTNLTLLNFTTTTERCLRSEVRGLGPGPGSTHILRVKIEYGPGSSDTNQTLHKTSCVFSINYLRKTSIQRCNVTCVWWNDQSVTTGLHFEHAHNVVIYGKQQPVTCPCPKPVHTFPFNFFRSNLILSHHLHFDIPICH